MSFYSDFGYEYCNSRNDSFADLFIHSKNDIIDKFRYQTTDECKIKNLYILFCLITSVNYVKVAHDPDVLEIRKLIFIAKK